MHLRWKMYAVPALLFFLCTSAVAKDQWECRGYFTRFEGSKYDHRGKYKNNTQSDAKYLKEKARDFKKALRQMSLFYFLGTDSCRFRDVLKEQLSSSETANELGWVIWFPSQKTKEPNWEYFDESNVENFREMIQNLNLKNPHYNGPAVCYYVCRPPLNEGDENILAIGE